jgi:osmotically inducible protein OsmC
MATAERRAEMVWEGDLAKGSGTVKVGSGATGELPVTWASRTERSEGKTSPEELIAAAHAACFSMALSNALAEGGAAPERLEVSATCSLDRVAEGLKITSMDLDVRGRVPGLDPDRFRDAAEQAKNGCPVSGALKGNVEIRLNATLEEA